MKINFGCGKDIREGYINVDIQIGKGIDKSYNFDEFPYPHKDNEFDYVYCNNVLEHLKYPDKVLKELHRITRKKGTIYIRVPYVKSLLAWNDLTHRHYFNLRSMEQLIKGHDRYEHKEKNLFNIISMRLRPTFYGKLFPKFLRKYVNYIFTEIFDMVEVELEVKKNE